MTMVSGTITGFASAISIRASMSSSRACGSREADMCSAAASRAARPLTRFKPHDK
jgi:hypothetical protein